MFLFRNIEITIQIKSTNKRRRLPPPKTEKRMPLNIFHFLNTPTEKWRPVMALDEIFPVMSFQFRFPTGINRQWPDY